MAIEQEFGRRDVLLAAAVLGVAWACGGCTDDDDAPDGGPILPSVR